MTARWIAALHMIVALAGLGSLSGCGQNTNLSVNILVPPDSDPFSGASSVILTLQGAMMAPQQVNTTVSSGKWTAMLTLSSPDMDNYVYLTVAGEDSSGGVVARGQTPDFLLPSSDTTVTVYVGRPGQVTTTSVVLPDDNGAGAAVGRKYMSGASLRGLEQTPDNEPSLGVIIAGGVNDQLQPLAHAWRYSPIDHQLEDAGTPMAARYGAVLTPSADTVTGQQAVLWGGMGMDMNNMPVPVTTAEIYNAEATDESTLWTAPLPGLVDPGAPGVFAPTAVEVKDSVFLITGGSSQPPGMAGGMAVNQAVIVQRMPGSDATMPAEPGVTRLPATSGNSGPMLAARSEHSATPVTVPTGSGALIFGGLSYADSMNSNVPVAELFLADKNTFSSVVFSTPPPSRRGHVALKLASGKVLIAGGYTEDAMGNKTVLDSALLIDPAAQTYTSLPGFLSSPRYAASINLLPQEVLICGGFDANSVPLATCDMYSTDDKLTPVSGMPIALPHARAGHLALPLETGQLVLIGGIGTGMNTVAQIDIYTAR